MKKSSVRVTLPDFDGKELQENLVAAYLIGMPIQKDTFQNIKVCETPKETNCF